MMLAYAQNVIVVPGYGLAVAQAQHDVREMAVQPSIRKALWGGQLEHAYTHNMMGSMALPPNVLASGYTEREQRRCGRMRVGAVGLRCLQDQRWRRGYACQLPGRDGGQQPVTAGILVMIDNQFTLKRR